jgi:hypothetical protein
MQELIEDLCLAKLLVEGMRFLRTVFYEGRVIEITVCQVLSQIA